MGEIPHRARVRAAATDRGRHLLIRNTPRRPKNVAKNGTRASMKAPVAASSAFSMCVVASAGRTRGGCGFGASKIDGLVFSRLRPFFRPARPPRARGTRAAARGSCQFEFGRRSRRDPRRGRICPQRRPQEFAHSQPRETREKKTGSLARRLVGKKKTGLAGASVRREHPRVNMPAILGFFDKVVAWRRRKANLAHPQHTRRAGAAGPSVLFLLRSTISRTLNTRGARALLGRRCCSS